MLLWIGSVAYVSLLLLLNSYGLLDYLPTPIGAIVSISLIIALGIIISPLKLGSNDPESKARAEERFRQKELKDLTEQYDRYNRDANSPYNGKMARIEARNKADATMAKIISLSK